MSDLVSRPAELHGTITIKRAATGKVEIYDLVGHIPAMTEDQLNELKGLQNGTESQHSGT